MTYDWVGKRRPASKQSPRVFNNLWSNEMDVWSVPRKRCPCVHTFEREPVRKELYFHSDMQDTSCVAWRKLIDSINEAAADKREEFSPSRDMTPSEWNQIVELPRSIAKLKFVKHLVLYGSSLIRIPPEIGEMDRLEVFSPYTSYRLHWFPYEITRCKYLRDSTVSTRATYGSHEYKPAFPKLPSAPQRFAPDKCSVCAKPLGCLFPYQTWVTRRVATDYVPLLVHTCSVECIENLPPPEEYETGPHWGGL